MAIADLLKNAGATTPPPQASASRGVSGLLASAKTGITPPVSTVVATPPPAPTPQSGIMSTLLNIPKDFISGLASSYGNAAQAIPQDVSTASSELQKEQSQPNTFGNEVQQAGTIVKAGGRAAGDFAGAVFAPISSAIGSALKATGAQSLIDDSGKIVATQAGITDMPAFQKFAMEHPNAGDDFQRLMNLALSGGEKGEIDPTKTAQDAKALATKVVEGAGKPPVAPPAAEPIVPASGLQGLVQQAQGPIEKPLDMTTLVDSTGKHDLRTAMTGLSDGGYSMKQISDIMGRVIQGNDSGRFTPQEISAVARTVKPENPIVPSDSSVIRTTSGKPIAPNKMGSLGYEPIPKENAAVEPGNLGTIEKTPTPVLPDAGTVSKAASDINTKLVNQGIEALPPEQLAKFTPTTKAEQIVKISALMDHDPEKAAQMALGHIPVEEGIHPTVLFNALSAAAEKAGNTKLLTDLASSPHASGSSLHGQGLSVSRFLRDPDSVMSNLQRIRDLKIESVGKDVVEKARSVAASEGNKVNLSKEDLSWNKFLDKITC